MAIALSLIQNFMKLIFLTVHSINLLISIRHFFTLKLFLTQHTLMKLFFPFQNFILRDLLLILLLQKKTYFRNVQFLQPPNVKFDCDFSLVSLIGTDITQIRFGNKIRWNNRNLTNIKRKNLKINNSNYQIYDEWLIEREQDPELQLESVMDVYRNLRENYDFSLRYEIAGEFFVREMDLKRKYRDNLNPKGKRTVLKNKIIRRIGMYAIYCWISQYGHSLTRPLLCSIPFLVIGTMAFLTEDFTNFVIQPNFHLNGTIVTAILRSLSGFIPVYSLKDKPEFMDIILKIILLPMAGTFFLALKRKLERKFRH